MLENPTAPSFTLPNSEVKILLYVGDLFLLVSTPDSLQQNLSILEDYWNIYVYMYKTKPEQNQKTAKNNSDRKYHTLTSVQLT